MATRHLPLLHTPGAPLPGAERISLQGHASRGGRILALLVILLAPTTALADSLGEAVVRLGRTIAFLELAIPDVRLEVGGGHGATVAFALPYHLFAEQLFLGVEPPCGRDTPETPPGTDPRCGRGFRVCSDCSHLGTSLGLSFLLEPEWAPFIREGNAYAGGRLFLSHEETLFFGVMIEGGGVVGSRGGGLYAGGGLGGQLFGIGAGVFARRVFYRHAPPAWSFTLDVFVPVQWLFAPRPPALR